MIQLKTRWADSVDAANVLPEYPRPNLKRKSYYNLNGKWDYCINKSKEPGEYEGKILVPYSPETLLSGVQKKVAPDDFLHYKKSFALPEVFKKDRILLHFGAVDQECEVFMNGQLVGSHKGGYNSFYFDVTNYLTAGENILTLVVRDGTEKTPHARGKQRYERPKLMSSLFYTSQSGIWKTVWLESVAEEYIENVKITPMFDEKSVELWVKTKGDCKKATVQIFDGNRVVKEQVIRVNQKVQVELGNFEEWSPNSPHLYDVRIIYNKDEVTSYFGMRKFHVEKDKKGILRFFMNNKPFFFNGILDQGYWPESLLTPPTDEALKYDIVKLKELGFNTIRKHIKVEPERFYYHCDKLGMIVWQDMPNGGGDYNMVFVTYLPNGLECAARGIRDNHYRWFKRKDAEGRAQYYEDLETMVEQLYNHPSIAVWVPFNEGWGQFDAKKATAKIRKIDATRLVNEACGWFDQGGGDMFSIHNYIRKLKCTPKKDRVVALTEYGGYAYPVKGHLACEKEFGYKAYKSKEELTANYKRLWNEEIYPNIERGLCSAIYTQTSDIEEEINGIMTYDREEVKFIETELKKLNKKLYQLFEKECLDEKRISY